MGSVSITSAPSFQARLLQSEQSRTVLTAIAWLAVLALILVRRWLGGAVMAVDAMFHEALLVMVVGLVFQAVMFADATRRRRLGLACPVWRSVFSAAADLAVPISILVMLQWHSPRGHVAALSAPAVLGLPLVTMLSILRLRPLLSLGTGLVGGLAHAGLVVWVLVRDGIDHAQWPVLFTYAFLIMLMGVVAADVARRMREHVRSAADEAVTAERTQRALEAVERDLAIARDIQQGLMPSTAPEIAGFEIAGMARPAEQTGGDYYDWQAMDDGRLVVALADVTGHGIGPALVMAVCHAYARASAQTTPDAAELLSKVNELIYKDLSSCGRFITMVIAILSPDGTVDLVSAGHGPTLLYRAATRSVEHFGGDGMPLGIDAAERYGPHRRIRLEPGDAILLATDGFMEWARAGDRQMFGLERLCITFRDVAQGSASSMLTGLDSAVQAFANGAKQGDDTTAVAIRRTATG